MTIYRGKAGKFASKAEIAAIKAGLTPPPTTREKLIAYKGFYKGNGDIPVCRNFHFETGIEYNIKGDPDPCYVGFHACTNPFDMFKYYSLNTENVFGRVKLLGPIAKRGDKQAAKGIIVEEIFSMRQLINVLADYAIANKLSGVNLNKQALTEQTWDIKTSKIGNYTNICTKEYGYQLSNLPGDNMYHHGYNSVQIGVGDSQYMFSSSTTQISAGENTTITNDSATGRVDVRGKHNRVRLLKQGAMFRGPVGTKFEIHASGKVMTGVVGENDIAPDKWTGFTLVRVTPEYSIELKQT